ncbi:MAG TPA: alpha/beta hydrolase, partial [Polyangia bacterium]|nr:alpha/beta hydrolase [Polyangia bacterium]
LRGSGGCVDLWRFVGYTEMVLDSHKAKVPEQIIAAVTGWLGEISATAATIAPPTETRPAGDVDWAEGPTGRIATDVGATVVETAAYLDPNGTTFGILAAPDRAPGERAATKGILLLNAGAIHHVGPNRLYVNFARRWAAMGHVVLRIDVSGIGDSPPRNGEPENVVYTARAMEDVSAALAHLRQQGIAKTYVMGLCSGAYNAVRAAAAGQSIDGVVPINPLTFFWKDGMSLDYPSHRVVADARRYSNSIRSLDAWKKVLRGQVKLGPVAQVALRDAAGRAVRHVRDAARAVGFPFAEDLGADLGNIARRGARIRFVFAADDPGAELLRVQGGSEVGRLRRKGALTTDVIYGPDHTFTPVWSHDVLGDCLTSILESGK